MGKAVILALAASFCTATSSVCQRLGVMDLPGGDGFNPRIVLELLRRPKWLVGIASMILGFGFQLAALHFGSLALVQPIIATELLFVFGYMAVFGMRRVVRRDWMAAAMMAAGLGVFLFTADPSGGHLHASATSWWLAAGAVLAAAAIGVAAAGARLGRSRVPSPSRRAATLGIATGISWGFVAAVIKELSSHTSAGLGAVFSNWSPYVVVVAGAASLLVATHALQAGPLPASQPGFTIADPLVASFLGVFVFGEHLHLQAADVAIEVIALAALVTGVVALSHSALVVGDPLPARDHQPDRDPSLAPHRLPAGDEPPSPGQRPGSSCAPRSDPPGGGVGA